MPTNNDVLNELRRRLDPEALSQTVHRWIRVPEILELLGDPAILDKLFPSGTAPSDIAQAIIERLPGQEHGPDLDKLPADVRTQVETWISASPLSEPEPDLTTIGVRALALHQIATEPDGPTTLAGRVLAEPDIWVAGLTTIWPYLEDPEAVAKALLAGRDREGVRMLATALLCHGTPAQAAATLAESFPGSAHTLFQRLRSLGEDLLAESLARDWLNQHSAADSMGVEQKVTEAAAQEHVNGPSAAMSVLENAWDQTSQLRAEIADRLAELAECSGDQVYAAEARQRAQSEAPSMDRRALAALALIGSKKIDEGLALIPQSASEPTDLAVIGLAYFADGRTNEGQTYLNKAAEGLCQGQAMAPDWLGRITHALAQLGNPGQAVSAASAWVKAVPGSTEARLCLAGALHESGDEAAAARQAGWLLAMDETQDAARQILAESLQALGRPGEALDHWQALAMTNAKALKPAIECALEAGEVDLAKQQASRWLALDPESPQALVMYGRTLTAAGELDAARDHLQTATERSPQSPETWLALVEAQNAMGDSAIAAETLGRAIQICPEAPDLLRVQADHLSNQGRLSEALDHLERARQLAPEDAQLQLSHGEVLFKLGHIEKAVPALEAAHAHRPSHLPTRVALAQAYEQIGDIQAAADLVKDMPDGASRDAHVLAGRLAARSAAKSMDRHSAEVGLHRLQLAEVDPDKDPETGYWLAEALRLSGRGEEAMAAYQACLGSKKAISDDFRQRAGLGLAQSSLDVGEAPVAISVLENIRREGLPSAAGLVLLSKAYRSAGLADEALSAALQAVELEPENQETRIEAIEVAVEAKSWQTALGQIERWVQANPQASEAWAQKGRVHAFNAQTSEARAALAKALKLGGASPDIVLSVAGTLSKLGEDAQAVRILRRAAHAAAGHRGLLRSLAESAERAGEHDAAYDAWIQLSENEPDDPQLLRQVGESLWRLNRRSEAIGYWQRAQAGHPDDVSLSVRLARAHIDNGEPDRGLEQFRQAVQSKPDDPELAVEAAAALTRFGKAEQAVRLLGTTASLVPDHLDVKVALADAFADKGDHQQSLEVLTAAAKGLAEPIAAVQARLSMALSNVGRHDEAQAAYAAIPGGKNVGDALWAGRAAVRLADWAGLDAAFAAGLADEHALPDQVGELADFLVRRMDAEWLYGQAGDVRRHRPDRQDSALLAASWEDRARAAGLASQAIAQLQAHLALAGGTLRPDETILSSDLPSWQESLAIGHLRNGDPDQVIDVLSSDPLARSSVWGPVLAGLAHLRSGRYVQARKAFGAAQGSPAVRPLAAYLTGQAWSSEGKIGEAIAAYNAALAAWPDEPRWHMTLAKAYSSVGELDSALPHLQQAVELEPADPEFRLSLARHLQDMGAHGEASEEFTKILSHYADEPDVWLQAGYASLSIGRAEEATSRFDRASQLAPDASAPLVGAARAAHAADNPVQAVQYAARAVDLAPEDPEALMAWAEMLGSQGKTDKALATYQRAGSLMVDPSPASMARSQLYLNTGRPEAAVLELRKVTENRPDDEAAWSALAHAHEAVGELDQASAAVKKALALAPALAHRMDLARLSRKAGQLDHALSEFSALQIENPNEADVAYELGRVHESRRDLAHALDSYRRAIVLDHQHAAAHFHAGLVLKTLKAYDEAAEMFRRAVDLNPRDPDAHHQLAAVRALELVHGGLRPNPVVAT